MTDDTLPESLASDPRPDLPGNWDYYQFRIATYLLSAVTYSDYSELSPADRRAALATLGDPLIRDLPVVIVRGSDDDFGLCEITRSRGPTIDVRFWFKRDASDPLLAYNA